MTHCLNAVHDQVQHHLLELKAIKLELGNGCVNCVRIAEADPAVADEARNPVPLPASVLGANQNASSGVLVVDIVAAVSGGVAVAAVTVAVAAVDMRAVTSPSSSPTRQGRSRGRPSRRRCDLPSGLGNSDRYLE